MPGYTAALAEMLRDTSSRALFDINMRCPSGKYAIVPRSLAKKSEVLGEMVEAVGDDDDGSSPVAPGGLLNEWISCSSRLQARELDPESTETLASYLKVLSIPMSCRLVRGATVSLGLGVADGWFHGKLLSTRPESECPTRCRWQISSQTRAQ